MIDIACSCISSVLISRRKKKVSNFTRMVRKKDNVPFKNKWAEKIWPVNGWTDLLLVGLPTSPILKVFFSIQPFTWILCLANLTFSEKKRNTTRGIESIIHRIQRVQMRSFPRSQLCHSRWTPKPYCELWVESPVSPGPVSPGPVAGLCSHLLLWLCSVVNSHYVSFPVPSLPENKGDSKSLWDMRGITFHSMQWKVIT